MEATRGEVRRVSVERHGEGARLECTRCSVVEIVMVDVEALRRLVGDFLYDHPRRCESRN